MNNSKEMDFAKVKEALDLLKPDGQLYEIRILKGKATISGYFTDTETLKEAFKTVDLRGANVFYTLNQIDDSCYSREQRDCFRQSKVTTSDGDIKGYRWMLVDLDPVRRTGISSTKDELIRSHDMAEAVVKYLRELGFSAPIMALSGNGIHLLYKIALTNTPEHTELISICLKALKLLFDDEYVQIDSTVANPSRISKLYGTMAQKGSSTKDRPHRMSRIIRIPDSVVNNEKDVLMKLASEYPDELNHQKVQKDSKSSFDVDEWLHEYGIKVHAVKTWKDATRYVLEECPFDGSHKAPDAAIIRMANGAICFKCLHNSCQGHDWRELRLKYEPDAYDDKRAEDEARIEAGWKAYKAYNRQRNDIAYQEAVQEEDPVKMFETVAEILAQPPEERICIPTGLTVFDKRVGGLAKGEISLVSGLRGAAKSTWLSQVVLNAVDKGFNALMYSGELKDKRFIGWLLQQAAGPDHVLQSKKYDGVWFCQNDVKPQIAEWLGDRFHLYNNKYGSNFKAIAECLRDVIRELKSDLVIIDNMSILDLTGISSDRRNDKWDLQKLFVETLKNLSMVCNCHIVFVAHPRKAMGFLRLDDVGGSGSLGNLVDNAFIVHRNNTDFRNGYAIYTGYKKRNQDDEAWGKNNGDNIIEVVKERETGMQDVFIPLWYEQKTRRLLNKPEERIIYGWDFDGFIGEPVNTDDLPFDTNGRSE